MENQQTVLNGLQGNFDLARKRFQTVCN
jgi:hypothetical protein